MPRKKRAPPSVAVATYRYTRSSDAPFSEEDAPWVGAELKKIADAHKLADLSLLTREIVFETVEKDPAHPLRQLYDWDIHKAARQHWLAHTSRIIRSIRVELHYGAIPSFAPAYLYCPKVPGVPVKAARVFTPALLDPKNDPSFVSAVIFRLKTIEKQLLQLEGLVRCRSIPPPEPIIRVMEQLRVAYDEFLASTTLVRSSDRAAE